MKDDLEIIRNALMAAKEYHCVILENIQHPPWKKELLGWLGSVEDHKIFVRAYMDAIERLNELEKEIND